MCADEQGNLFTPLKNCFMLSEFILKQNVLTDNILIVPSEGKILKGGYIAIIKEYQYQNASSDKEVIKRFRNKSKLMEYLSKYYPQVDIDLHGTCLG